MARRKPFVNATLRIDEGLHRRLRESADARLGTFNSEVKWRLERSYRDDKARDLEQAAQDVVIAMAKLSTWFADREIQDAIVEAVLARNFELAHRLALGLRHTQAKPKGGAE
jgi:hypothetical protein